MADDLVVTPRDRYLDEVFGEKGLLARAFDGYTPRPGQIALARAVDESLASGRHLLAEAPTGTGKSVAYAVPAIYHASQAKKCVLIVTANIALQEQLVTKDLPMLAKLLPWPFTFALSKGISNYLCMDRFFDSRARRMARGGSEPSTPEEEKQREILYKWAEASISNAELETGDVSEIRDANGDPFEPSPRIWRGFSVTSDECKGTRCKYVRQCFGKAAGRAAREADVIVTNYHMLMAHLGVYADTGQDLVLPPFHYAILDEAHKAPDICREAFGFKISLEQIRRVVSRIVKRNDALAGQLDDSASWLFRAMSELYRDKKRYKARLDGKLEEHETRAWTATEAALQKACELLASEYNAIECAYEELKELFDLGDVTDPEALGRVAGVLGIKISTEDAMLDEASDLVHESGLALKRGAAILSGLRASMSGKSDSHVFYLEEDEHRGRLMIRSKLVRPGDALAPNLFGKNVAPPGGVPEGKVTVICTSATLSPFDFMRTELGGPEDISTLVCESPFDWENQCLFIAPETMPEPNDPAFRDAVAKHLERAVLFAGGRTLGLFTSRRVMEHAFDALWPTCRRHGWRLMKQGEMPRTALVRAFKNDVTSVLLGLESFWAGIDVPGESLSVVVIDRLPFPTPDDPICAALAERDDKWFFKYAIPRGIIQFKQGVGRLIRSKECRGVVVCLDRRLIDKNYGKQFLRALPPVPKTMRLEAMVDWLAPRPELAWDEIPPNDDPPAWDEL